MVEWSAHIPATELALNEKPKDQLDEDTEWPFPQIPPDAYWSLPEADRAGLEQIIRDMINKTNSKH